MSLTISILPEKCLIRVCPLQNTLTQSENPLLYLPLLSGMQNLSEFAFIGLQGFVNFCVFGLGVIALTVWTIWRILKKPKTAIIAGLLLCLYPWFIRIYHGPTEKYDILSHFGLWLAHPVDINFMGFYYYTDFVGFNAMSDMPALFFGLLGLVLLHRRLQNEKSLLLPRAVIGVLLHCPDCECFLFNPDTVSMS